ncbi:unnamed protein product, partial [Phaeothamnion confervicola]
MSTLRPQSACIERRLHRTLDMRPLPCDHATLGGPPPPPLREEAVADILLSLLSLPLRLTPCGIRPRSPVAALSTAHLRRRLAAAALANGVGFGERRRRWQTAAALAHENGRDRSGRDVRVDTKLNKHLFSKGVRNVVGRVRVRLS